MHLTCYSAEMANEGERGSIPVALAQALSANQADLIRRLDAAGFETDSELAERGRIWAAFHRRVELLITNGDRYPHTCPRCSGPAYVGAVEVDCAGGCK